MSQPFQYQTQFVLDRSHYQECFDQSVVVQPGLRPYLKAAGFVLTGFALFALPLDSVIGYLFLCLGIIEGLSVKFRRSWWLWRQMMSKAANHSVNFAMDEHAIVISSEYVKQQIKWDQVDSITATEQGYLLNVGKGRSYVSRRILDEQANAFIQAKMAE